MEKVVRLKKEKDQHTPQARKMERLIRIANREEKLSYDQAPRLTKPQKEGEKDHPVVRIVDLLISTAISNRTSDIHIEPQENGILVRNRIDGTLRTAYLLPKFLQAPLISRIKIMAHMDISQSRFPQDGRIKAGFSGKILDLRIASIPALHGEKVVLRLLDVDATSIPLEGIGFAREMYESIVSLIKKPQGIIFVTGPTGSGKTSTLYAMLNHIISENINIVTLEDPIEYEIKGATQIAIKENINLTFAKVLRAVLRQDPDVIMVGEMRDAETSGIAMQASLTGHLVFSTMHTNDSVSAVTRLLDMGIPSYLIASSVNAVLAQRLVRNICPECKDTYQPPEKELIRLGINPKDGFDHFYRGKGCRYCDFTGFYGRTGIFELAVIDDEMRALILSDASESFIRDRLHAKGMQPLFKDGLRKIKDGKTTTKEVLKIIG